MEASARAHTFLFTDLVGFTALTAARGDDHAVEVALDFYARVRRMLPAHRAEEVKTIGDALMLRCDDPGLAIKLGLGVVRELEAVPGFPPVRVGMHTGTAVNRDADWYGTTVNVAARLCSATGGGQVLVSEETCVAAGPIKGVRLEEPELHWLKNVTAPVAGRVASETTCLRSRLSSLRLPKTAPRARLQAAHP